MDIHFQTLALGAAVVTLSNELRLMRMNALSIFGEVSDNSSIVVNHSLETILHALQQEPSITAISLSSARAVGILRQTQKCPEVARETLKKILNLNRKIAYGFRCDESLRRQCQQKLLAAGGRVLESWTLHERLYLNHMASLVNLTDISSKAGYPVTSLLELSRPEISRILGGSEWSPNTEEHDCMEISTTSDQFKRAVDQFTHNIQRRHHVMPHRLQDDSRVLQEFQGKSGFK